MTRPFLPEGVRELVDAVLAWQQGTITRDELVALLCAVPAERGADIQAVVRHLCQRLEAVGGPPGSVAPVHASLPAESVGGWRAELMGSRARAWAYPNIAGLLVGPGVLLLMDSREGVVLRDGAAACLPASVCGSLVLLCQTIVMAQSAVDAQELQKLQRQRIESTSTSLSEIEPVS